MDAKEARDIIRKAIQNKALSSSQYLRYQQKELQSWNGKEPVKKLDAIDIKLASKLEALKISLHY